METTPLAIDIETTGRDWDEFSAEIQKYLLERKSNEDIDEATVIDRLGLHPGTGKIIAIGMWRPVENSGGLLLESSKKTAWTDMEGVNAKVYQGTEKDLLEQFWSVLNKSISTIITYNGRSFDGPYLLIRSSMLEVKPSRNLLPYRYSFNQHCDLAEVLSFHRSRPLDSFDFWCQQFGIESPKDELDGSKVRDAYERGETESIGRYALRDAWATAELYKKLRPLIHLLDSKST